MLRRLLRSTGLLLALSSLLAVGCGGKTEARPDAQLPPDIGEEQLTVQLNTADDTFLGTGEATLTRFRRHVTVAGTVDTLTEGETYTVWWRIFGVPRECTRTKDPTKIRCSEADLEIDKAAPAFGFCDSFAYAGGSVEFACERSVDDGPFAPDADGLGSLGQLEFPDSEIHMMIRTHGPTLTGDLAEAQLANYMGGCKSGEPNDGLCAEPIYFPFIFCDEGHGVICPDEPPGTEPVTE